MKFQVVPFVESTGSKEYKDILLQDFYLEFLYKQNGNFDNTLFYAWHGMEMMGLWYKVENYENKVILEFYDTYYHIFNKKGSLQTKFVFPYPRTVDDFINDCNRCGVELFWNENAVRKYSPKAIMKPNDIDQYYKDILLKIGKL